MTQSETIEKLIYPVIDEIKGTLPDPERLKKSPDTALFGSDAALDSLGLVSFIVLVEERIEGHSGRGIRLVSANAMSRKNSPFRTVATLADYIVELLGDGAHE